MDDTKLTMALIENLLSLVRTSLQKQFGQFVRGESYILNNLLKRSDAALPSELSADMGISTARVAVILNNLENKEYITREMDSSDRRKILVRLTEKGKMRIVDEHKQLFENTRFVIREIGEEDAHELIRILQKIVTVSPTKDVPCVD